MTQADARVAARRPGDGVDHRARQAAAIGELHADEELHIHDLARKRVPEGNHLGDGILAHGIAVRIEAGGQDEGVSRHPEPASIRPNVGR